MDVHKKAAARIAQFVDQVCKNRIAGHGANIEFQAIRNLLRLAPDACLPLIPYMATMIARGGLDWESTQNIANALLDHTPELHGVMREKWRDPLLFQILARNAPAGMQEIAKRLDLASELPDQGSLGVARAMKAKDQKPLFIIGAGFSYDSMPLTQELEALVTGLLAGMGVENPVQLLKENWVAAWEHIAKKPDPFKQRFIGFSQGRLPSIQHRVLNRALIDKTIAGVVSFNWDDHIERSGGRCTVVNSDDQAVDGPGLWKMHGDVNAPDVEWVWPHEDGRPFKNVCEYVIGQARAGHISYVVVIGYGEREKNIVDALLNPLHAICGNWIRVRPAGQEGPNGQVTKTARQFMGELESFQVAIAEGLI